MTQEGKTSTCAHSDLMGNLVMQCCDLWSNESVEYHGEFGGTTVQCWAETLAYDCSMMNVALKTGKAKDLRDILVLSDKYRDPQGYVLAYDNAYRVEAIVKTETTTPQSKERRNRMLQHRPKVQLQARALQVEAALGDAAPLEALPDDMPMDDCLTKYQRKLRSSCQRTTASKPSVPFSFLNSL